MADVLISMACAAEDAEAVAAALRAACVAPVHIRTDAVLGRDYSDAGTAEQVTGRLERTVLELIVAEETAEAIVEAAAGARRRLPIRWHMTAVLKRGRVE